MNYKWILIITVALLGLVAWGWQCTQTAPDATFVTITGQKVQMADLRGKITLIHFWATDCPACNEEMPDLINTYQTYKNKGLEIIAIAMPYDPPAQLLNYQQEKHLPFPIMHDGLSEMVQKFGNVDTTPTTLIYSKQGKLLQRTVGKLDFAYLHQLLNQQGS